MTTEISPDLFHLTPMKGETIQAAERRCKRVRLHRILDRHLRKHGFWRRIERIEQRNGRWYALIDVTHGDEGFNVLPCTHEYEVAGLLREAP